MRLTRKMCGLAGLAILALAGCDKPGPLSAAAKREAGPPPPPPAWAAALAGRPLKDAFPVAAECIGSVDTKTDRYKDARKVVGWAWSRTASQAVAHVAAVDADGRMLGFGEGGIDRQDVPAARPEVRARNTGWWLIAPIGKSYTVYGLDAAGRSACVVGALSL
jgi:hypothetical protein